MLIQRVNAVIPSSHDYAPPMDEKEKFRMVSREKSRAGK